MHVVYLNMAKYGTAVAAASNYFHQSKKNWSRNLVEEES